MPNQELQNIIKTNEGKIANFLKQNSIYAQRSASPSEIVYTALVEVEIEDNVSTRSYFFATINKYSGEVSFSMTVLEDYDSDNLGNILLGINQINSYCDEKLIVDVYNKTCILVATLANDYSVFDTEQLKTIFEKTICTYKDIKILLEGIANNDIMPTAIDKYFQHLN